MEIRDPVHGSISILKHEIPIINHKFFRRLRNIKQLGLSEYSFPGATHTRFIHSVGVMNVANKAFNKLFKDFDQTKELLKIKMTFKLACLLHDIGHAPLSHSTELVMPKLELLKIPTEFLKNESSLKRQATHEDYTIKSIVDSSFASAFHIAENEYGISRKAIAELISGHQNTKNYFTINNKNYFSILHQLVSSELDCDRMDYLLRDSYFCGVSYGNFDLDWLIDNLEACPIGNNVFLGISERATSTFDDFLLSRYHMFLMVYFHYRSVCHEQLLARYFKTSNEYSIPSDIEDYQNHDDHYLMRVLRESNNKFAKAIVNNQIPEKIYESFNARQYKILKKIETYLIDQEIDYINSSSKGRLSKYYSEGSNNQQSYTLKVSRSDLYAGKQKYVDINEATELFEKYSSTHFVNRLHCDTSELSKANKDQIKKIIKSD